LQFDQQLGCGLTVSLYSDFCCRPSANLITARQVVADIGSPLEVIETIIIPESSEMLNVESNYFANVNHFVLIPNRGIT